MTEKPQLLKFKKPFKQYEGRILVDSTRGLGKTYLVKYLSSKDPSNGNRKGYLGVGYGRYSYGYESEIREFWFYDDMYYLEPIGYEGKKEVVRAIFNEAK